MPLIGGSHTVTAAWKKLNSEDSRYFRQLTIRIEDNAAANVSISTDGVNAHFYLKTDESLTFNDTGSVSPKEIWLRGTAGDIVYYIGTPV